MMESRMMESMKESGMKTANRPVLACALFAAAALMAHGQQTPYAGTSNPPPDDQIIDNTPQEAAPPAAIAKPPAAYYAQPAAPAQPAYAQPANPQPAYAPPAAGADDGIVQVAPNSNQPQLNPRYASDPDGDIVHPAPLPPGTISEGTEIRVRLLDRLSSAMNQGGDPFHARVASEVFQNGQVLIPAGAEIEGKVVEASSGRVGGRGTMMLRPDTVVMPDGSRFRLYAQITGTPGSRTHVGREGDIAPDMPLKKDGIEYGAAVGAGAVTGAIVGGPVGALAGTLIGAGAVTVHLLVSHPQATLESGTVLLFTLTEPLSLVPATQPESAPVAQAAPPVAQMQN
jgi:hypothetical protein